MAASPGSLVPCGMVLLGAGLIVPRRTRAIGAGLLIGFVLVFGIAVCVGLLLIAFG